MRCSGWCRDDVNLDDEDVAYYLCHNHYNLFVGEGFSKGTILGIGLRNHNGDIVGHEIMSSPIKKIDITAEEYTAIVDKTIAESKDDIGDKFIKLLEISEKYYIVENQVRE